MLVFTPPKSDRLVLSTAYRTVTLNWSHNEQQVGYCYKYKCRGGASYTSEIIEGSENQLTLSDSEIKEYKPFNFCVFCIYVLWYYGGNPSPACCNQSRLSEEAPSRGPMIRYYDDNTCPTRVGHAQRNLTLYWQLPDNTTWNGVITTLLISTISNNQRHHITVPRHADVNNASISIRLNTTNNYVIFMKACNKAGCSRQGNSIEIPSCVNKELTTFDKSSSNLYYIFFVLAPIIAILAWYIYRHVTNTNTGARLPDLSEPKDCHYNFPNNNNNNYEKINA